MCWTMAAYGGQESQRPRRVSWKLQMTSKTNQRHPSPEQSSDGQSDFEDLETSVNVEASAGSTSSGGGMATGRLGVEAPDSSDDSTGSPNADTIRFIH